MPRSYEMTSRTRAKMLTRESILDSAVALFSDAWFDEVTLADVARHAGVSSQTIVNHFGAKIGLYLAGLAERVAPEILAERARAVPGDVTSIVEAAVRDYERTGDGAWRNAVLAERVPELRQVVEGGRRSHRAWIEEMFAPQLSGRRGAGRERTVQLLVVVLDAATWKSLRRDAGLDESATAQHLQALVDGVLA